MDGAADSSRRRWPWLDRRFASLTARVRDRPTISKVQASRLVQPPPAPPDQRQDDREPARRGFEVSVQRSTATSRPCPALACRSTPKQAPVVACAWSTATARGSPASPPRKPRRWPSRVCPAPHRLGLGTVLAAAQPQGRRGAAARAPQPRGAHARSTVPPRRPGWLPGRSRCPTRALSRAVWEEQRVEIRYRSATAR